METKTNHQKQDSTFWAWAFTIAIGLLILMAGLYVGFFVLKHKPIIERGAFTDTWFNQSYDFKQRLQCERPNEVLYLYVDHDCPSWTLTGMMRSCNASILCDVEDPSKDKRQT